MLIEGVAVMRAVAAIRVSTREKLFVRPDVISDRPAGGSMGRAALRFAGKLAAHVCVRSGPVRSGESEVNRGKNAFDFTIRSRISNDSSSSTVQP